MRYGDALRSHAGTCARVLLLLVCASAAGCDSRPTSVGSTSKPSTTVTEPAASPLEGAWESGSLSAAQIRSVVVHAGFTAEDADAVVGDTGVFEFRLRFADGEYALSSTWDGTDMGILESGSYRLTADRLRLGTGESGDSYTFAIDLEGERFKLRLLRTTESGSAEDEYTHAYHTTAFYTGHGFTRTA